VARCWIGTSGWNYPDWRGVFYPAALSTRHYLEFYAREFPTAEINYSFYHLPKPATYANWAAQVPSGFLFAVKASRLITHTKRLSGVSDAWQIFVSHAQALGAHLGPFLLQFPSTFRRDQERLAAFLEQAAPSRGPDGRPLRLVFEFRHESWFVEATYRLLEQHGATLCLADSPAYPRRDVRTADFVYLRFHGRPRLYVSSYSEAELASQAQQITRYLAEGLDVFVYFNNTVKGHAIENARMLRRLVGT
jgi:uncharacterized protein YecE (DUF72 family)